MDPLRSGLLAAGNFIVDHVKMIDGWPAQEKLVSILSQKSSNGGGPYNVTKDLSKLFPNENGKPFPLSAAGLVGDDTDGRWILEDCETHGIDTTLLKTTSDEPTSYTDVMTVDSDARRTFFHLRGANALFDENCIDFSGVKARIFYLGYLPLLDSLEKEHPDGRNGASILLDRARSSGLATVLDLVSIEIEPERFRAIVEPSLSCVDLLLTNEIEASLLSGIALNGFDPASARDLAEAIFELGVNQMVVIHAENGAVVVENDGTTHSMGSVRIPKDEIEGTVGAGDAFAAGFLYGFHEDLDRLECLRIGACVAASCLRNSTTSGGILPLEDCLALGEQWGFRDFA